MKILVVGGAGYIGCEVVDALNRDVWILDIAGYRAPMIKAKFVVDSVLALVDHPTVLQTFDAVINLTGGLDDAHLFGMIGSPFMSQVCAPFYLRQCNPDMRIVHVSTQYVYSGAGMHKERGKAEPVCDYGIGQLMAESSLVGDPNSVILRFGTVWGRSRFQRQDTWGNHFLYDEEPFDENHPDDVISMLGIKNAVRVIEWALTAKPNVYNVADLVGLKRDIIEESDDLTVTYRPQSGGLTVGMDCSRIRQAGFSFEERP